MYDTDGLRGNNRACYGHGDSIGSCCCALNGGVRLADSVERFCGWRGRHSDVDWDTVSNNDTSKRSGNSLVDTDAGLVGLLQADSTLQHMSAPKPSI